MEIDCFAAMSKAQPLERFRYEPRDLGEDDVLVSIDCCGLCRDDLHYGDDDLGLTQYPFVPGHEIVGRVASRGRRVGGLTEGDRVGIGWQGGCCGECEWCARGEEHLCPKPQPTFSPYGGFASAIVVDGRFVFPLPDRLRSEDAAALMCSGAAAYGAFRSHGVGPAMKVGVVGIGGVGHLAIQFARAIGCGVTAFSSTPVKKEDAQALGAHHFASLGGEGRFPGMDRSLDFILSTVPSGGDTDAFLSLLRPKGILCLAGHPRGPIPVDPRLLSARQASICGGVAAGRDSVREMLAFALLHGVSAWTELMPMEKANEAIARLRGNKARYAIVLHNR